MSSNADTDAAQDNMRKPLVAAPLAHPNRPRLGRDAPMVDVQPPRREDLQPSYAKVLGDAEAESDHGFYGSMSKSLCAHNPIRVLTIRSSQLPRELYWHIRCCPMLHLLS